MPEPGADTSARRPLSAVIIACNEADNIGDCIRSVAWADEVLVVDSGSSDDTVDIAKSLGARVIHQAWLGFGRQKQVASGQARHDWILNIDADERPDALLCESIRRALAGNRQPAAYACNFRHRIMGRWLKHGEAWPDPHVRLYDRRHAAWNSLPIHEHVEVQGEVNHNDGGKEDEESGTEIGDLDGGIQATHSHGGRIRDDDGQGVDSRECQVRAKPCRCTSHLQSECRKGH